MFFPAQRFHVLMDDKTGEQQVCFLKFKKSKRYNLSLIVATDAKHIEVPTVEPQRPVHTDRVIRQGKLIGTGREAT